jgi:hypothetical protein
MRFSRLFCCFTLAVMLFSTLSAATALGDLAAQMQPGQWRELNTLGFNNGRIFVPSTGIGSILQYMDEAQWDPVGKKIYIIGTSRGAGDYGISNQKWICYAEATNTWTELPRPAFYVGFHTYDHAALDPNGRFYYVRIVESNEVRRCYLENLYWTGMPPMPTSSPCCSGLEYFPELNGVVFVTAGTRNFCLYDLSTNRWSTIPGGYTVGTYHVFSEYNAKHKFLYFGGGEGSPNSLYKLDSTRAVTRLASAPVRLGHGGCAAVQVLDPNAGKLVVFSCSNDGTYEYNPASDSWTRTGSHNLTDPNNLLAAAAPIPEHGVIFVARHGYDNIGKVYLYRHSAGSSGLSQKRLHHGPASGMLAISPNPAVSRLNISLNAWDPVSSRLVVLDACGRTVSDLTDRVYHAQVNWDTSQLPAGVYTVVVTGEGLRAAGKVMVLK